ncbi:MAG: nitroreductase family protein [Rhodospirillales bacterium]|jgi:nitroreductase|nr:nitroreductase family protein [Rhodospirillales bacterium]
MQKCAEKEDEDTIDALQALTTRRSASKLGDPEPPPEVLEACLEAAIRAPDHGRLRSWCFILIRREGRQRLGEVMAEAFAARDAGATEAMVGRARAKLLRAPPITVAVAKVEPEHEKMPEIEQVLAAGAAA